MRGRRLGGGGPSLRKPAWQDEPVRTPEEQVALRTAAMEWLASWTNDGLDPIGYEDLRDFTFRGEKQPLKDRQKGIYKPRGMDAALSIATTYRRPEAERPYDDAVGPDGLLRYKWRGTDPNLSDNRALREAMHEQAPLIWFWGVAPGVFKPIYPVYLRAEEPEQHQFVVVTDGLQDLELHQHGLSEVERRYNLRETKARLHQPVFRSMVMAAYETRCTICELRHSALLDAAHIVDDSAEGGIAAVRNGMAMCKIHHAAYDAGILGVRPDLTIEIREDILEEIDGPILEHGLKRLHGERLRVVPRHRLDRPDPQLLETHFERFRTAPIPGRPRLDIAFTSPPTVFEG